MKIVTKNDFITTPSSVTFLKTAEIIIDSLMMTFTSSDTLQYYFAEVDELIFIYEENLVTSNVEILVIKTKSDYVLKLCD